MTASLAPLAAAVPAANDYLPVIHCFEFRGILYAYFVRTGDLLRVSVLAFEALSAVGRGLALEAVQEELCARHPGAEAELVCGDLARLREAGYLSPEVDLSSEALSKRCESLLVHRPRNIMFFVTEACNLACTYCYEKNQGVHDKPQTLRQVDARKILERFFEEGKGRECSVTFFGGEPLLNFSVIRDAVNYSKELAAVHGTRVGFTMTSNLTLLTEEMADFLAEHQFHVMVSLDGSKEANDRYRVFKDGSGSYDAAVRNLQLLIRKMKDAGVRLPKIRATMTAENSDPFEVERSLRALGTHLVEIGETHGTVAGGKEVHDVGAATGQHAAILARTQREIERIFVALERDPDVLPDIPGQFVKGLQKVHETISQATVPESPEPKLCGVCRNMKAVTPGGDLYPCHRYVGMPAFKFGNVHAGGLDLNRVRKYYEDIYHAFGEKCAKCWARHLCGGQCPWYLSRSDGSIALPDDPTCDLLRAGFESFLGFYALLLERFPVAFQRILALDPKEILGEPGLQAPDMSCRT